MKVLNLYAGLGGNRKKWGSGIDITAVEKDPSVAKYYADHYPNDQVIIGDAHQYLLDHYQDFDFIWTSPPCPTHSKARFWASKGGKIDPVYPDMSLYQEVIFLRHYFKGKWVVENVDPFYTPLIRPSVKIGRHLFWSNFQIIPIASDIHIHSNKYTDIEKLLDISMGAYKFNQRRDKIIRNCVNPHLGLHILQESQREGLFKSLT